MSRLRIFLSLTLSVISITMSGCTKAPESGSKGENQLLAERLLKKLPASTAGFSVIDLTGQGYKNFKTSPFGATKNAKKSLDTLLEKAAENSADDAQLKLVRSAFDATVKLGILTPEGEYTPEKVFSKVVVFGGASNDQSMPIEGGIFAEGSATADLTEKLKVLQTFLTEAGLRVTPEKIGTTDGIAVGTDNTSIKLYVGATKTTLGIAFLKPTVETFFSQKETETLATVKALPEFQKATASLPVGENPVAFAFASLKRLQPLLELIAKRDESGQLDPKNIPVDGIAAQTHFAKQYINRINVALSPRTESQTKVLAALEGSSLSPIGGKLPANTAVALSLDAKMVAKLDTFLQSIKDGGADEDVLQQTKRLEGIVLGLRNNTAGSPIPDLYISIESSNRTEAGKFIESGLGMAMSLAGQNTSWLSKEIDASPTKYFTTMIGAGVYVSYPKDSKALLIGTSEAVIRDVLASQSDRAPSFTAPLPTTLKTQLNSINLASFYCNFPQVADIGESVKNTLAMFTGGNSELNDALNFGAIRNWGIGVGGVSYTAGVVSIQSSFDFQPSK